MKKLIIIFLLSFLFISEAYSDNYNKLKNTPTSLLEHRNHLLEHELRKFFNYESINVNDYKDGVFISFMPRDACKIIRSNSTLSFYAEHSPNELQSIGYGGSKYHCDTMSEPKENQVLGCFNIEQLSELCGATINYFIKGRKQPYHLVSHTYGIDISNKIKIRAQYNNNFWRCEKEVSVSSVSCTGMMSNSYNSISYKILRFD